jgi:hypothetical protein
MRFQRLLDHLPLNLIFMTETTTDLRSLGNGDGSALH